MIDGSMCGYSPIILVHLSVGARAFSIILSAAHHQQNNIIRDINQFFDSSLSQENKKWKRNQFFLCFIFPFVFFKCFTFLGFIYWPIRWENKWANDINGPRDIYLSNTLGNNVLQEKIISPSASPSSSPTHQQNLMMIHIRIFLKIAHFLFNSRKLASSKV